MKGLVSGVSLGFWQDSDPMEAVATAAAAAACGHPEVWVGEMATFDAFALGAAIGKDNPELALTVGPLAPSVRDVVGLAMGVASVQALTGCRTALAIGASSPTVVSRWHGRPYTRTATGLREAATALRPLLDGEKVSQRGELMSTDGYHLRLEAPRSPLTVAAFGPASVRLAGQLADRMVVNLCTQAQVAKLRDALAAAAQQAGRPTPPLAVWVPAAIAPEPAGRRQLARALVAYLAAPGYGEMFSAAGFGELVERARQGTSPKELLAEVPDELPEVIGLIGDESSCRRRAQEYADAGADEVVLVPVTAGDPAGHRTLSCLSPALVP